MDYLVGGLAGMGAAFFSNPMDVVKTRMQLQGELRARGKYAVPYRNIFHATYNIVKHDGIIAMQKGLVPALWNQMVVNSVRLGVYQKGDDMNLLRDEKGNTKFWNSLFFGCFTGGLGAYIGSPLQLVKTQLMAYSDEKIAVGTQHKHKGCMAALLHIYRKNGLAGLWRGAEGMALRSAIGSAAQFCAFAKSKEWIAANNLFQQSTYLPAFMASNVSAFFKTLAITPMDVVMTRLYNQKVDESGKGQLYNGIWDTIRKIIKIEGPLAFYKGVTASYMRQAPYTVLLLVFWDILKDLQKSLGF